MNEYVISSFPLVGSVTSMVIWLFLVIVLLIGVVLLLAFRLAALQERVDVLEHKLASENDMELLNANLSEDDDCRPITLVQHRPECRQFNSSSEAH